jgi:hypothetical protein
MGQPKVESPQGHAAGRDINTQEAPRVEISEISGGTNIVGNSGHVVIQVNPARAPRVANVIKPGPEHIGQIERRALQDLCTEWVTLHNTLKKQPLTHAAAWSRINKAGGSDSYHLIRRDRYDDVLRYVRQQMAILRAMASAPAKDDQWRNKRIAAIKLRCRNQLADPDAYRPYVRKNFGAESLTDLSTDQLQRTYAYIFAKKT